MKQYSRLLLHSAALVIASIASIRCCATPVYFDLAGVLTTASVTHLDGPNFNAGDQFTGTLSYDSYGFGDGNFIGTQQSLPVPGSYAQNFSGWFHLEITVGGTTFQSAGEYHSNITSDASGDSMRFYSAGDDMEKTPFSTADSWLNLCFAGAGGGPISTDYLPTELDLNTWSASHFFEFNGDGGFGDGNGRPDYDIVGEFTSVAPVPDTGSSAWLLAMVIIPLTFISKNQSRREQR